MAVTGLFFVVFVLFHMYGNLKMFGGPESYNGYAHHLRTMFQPILPYEGFLWIFRLTLIIALAAHVRDSVEHQFGVVLEHEVRFMGRSGETWLDEVLA